MGDSQGAKGGTQKGRKVGKDQTTTRSRGKNLFLKLTSLARNPTGLGSERKLGLTRGGMSTLSERPLYATQKGTTTL